MSSGPRTSTLVRSARSFFANTRSAFLQVVIVPESKQTLLAYDQSAFALDEDALPFQAIGAPPCCFRR